MKRVKHANPQRSKRHIRVKSKLARNGMQRRRKRKICW